MRKDILGGITLLVMTTLGIFGVNSNTKSKDLSNLSMYNVEALAGGESDSVTCNSDPGDTCVVGNTTISDYDEGCASWFWG
jgi:hypothetical protein